MNEKAKRRIAKVIRTKAIVLNLAGCGLKEIPEELANMPWLMELDLSYNEIKEIQGLKQLSKLTELDLSYNQIQVIQGLEQLPNLTTLWLRDNQIQKIEGLEQLFNLTTLWLRDNKIRLIEGLEQLSNLTGLELINNQIQEIQNLEQLTKLVTLNLRNNQIQVIQGLKQLSDLVLLNLSDNQIKEIQGLGQLSNLTELNLKSNQIQNILPLRPLIKQVKKVTLNIRKWHEKDTINLHNNPITHPPIEIVQQGKKAILNYFESKEDGQEDQMFEAKMLILGGGGVGKTSLCEKIKDKNYKLKSEVESATTTEGIDILDYNFPIANSRKFKVNIWDFGGQSIYHATHQFFLTKRSLYILVTDTRKEDDDLPYWLNIQQLLAGDSPMLIIQNEKHDRKKPLKKNEIRGSFNNVKGILSTNLKNNRGLEQIIKEVHAELQKLNHIGDKLPKSWVDIRRELEAISKPFISQKEYFTICAKHGMKGADGKPDKKKAMFLSHYFHDLGVILHFSKDPILKRIVMLDNEWATDAVYKVLDNKKVKDNWGRFSFEDLETIWSAKKYEGKQVELEALMEKFKLCFQLKGKREYLAPQLLPVDKINYDWGKEQSLQLKYTYEFMPKGILARLIVEMHTYVKEEFIWNTGGIFEKDGATAEVMEVYNKNEISLRIKGNNAAAFRAIVMNEMDKINAEFQNLQVEKLVPCNCKGCRQSATPIFYKEEKLLKYYQYQKKHFECEEPPFEKVNVLGLLSSINSKALQDSLTRNIRNLIKEGVLEKVFIFFNENMDSIDSESQDKILLLSNRFNRAQNDFNKEVLGQEKFNVEQTKIAASILALTKNIAQ